MSWVHESIICTEQLRSQPSLRKHGVHVGHPLRLFRRSPASTGFTFVVPHSQFILQLTYVPRNAQQRCLCLCQNSSNQQHPQSDARALRQLVRPRRFGNCEGPMTLMAPAFKHQNQPRHPQSPPLVSGSEQATTRAYITVPPHVLG